MAKDKVQNNIPRKHRKNIVLVISLVLILTLTIGGTLAYWITKTPRLANQFGRAYVTSRVNVNGETISVTNTGNVDAYIRAAVVVNWVDADGKVYAIVPEGATYSLGIAASQTFSDDKPWYQDPSTGFYYHKESVASYEATEALITSITTGSTVPAGYELLVEVVAEAIQAGGDTEDGSIPAVQNAWDIDIYGSDG